MKHGLAKVPHKEKARLAAHLKQIWLEPDKKSARRAAAALIDDYGKRFPIVALRIRRSPVRIWPGALY